MRTVYIYCEQTNMYECSGLTLLCSSFRWENLSLAAVYLFEIATASLLPVHHVVEDGDHDIPQIGLRHQRHLQERTNHRRDEVQLVLPWRRDRGRHRGHALTLSLNTADCLCQRQSVQLLTTVFFSLKNSTTIQAAVIIWFKCTALQSNNQSTCVS